MCEAPWLRVSLDILRGIGGFIDSGNDLFLVEVGTPSGPL